MQRLASKQVALVIALTVNSLAVGAPTLAQTPTDWTKPVTGVDAPPVDEEALAREWEQTQAIYGPAYGRSRLSSDVPVAVITADMLAAETPLPPPCEPPVTRAPSQPGPPKPPAPCSPVK